MSSFGTLFRITTFGESHGKGVGVIVDGVPPCIPLTEADIQPQLSRRRPGQSDITTPRNEADQVTIQSGVEHGLTLGSPISCFVPNLDQRPHDYTEMSKVPRPSHADFTYQIKYGVRSVSGGGRSSARETIGRVAAGAIAEKWLFFKYGIEIVSFVSSVKDVCITPGSVNLDTITRAEVDKHITRCPDATVNEKMAELIRDLKEKNDSCGGVLTCVCRNVPAGWGEPCFDKLEARLAHAMLSIPATKGFDIGSGFEGIPVHTGSSHNDPFVKKIKDGKEVLGTSSNFSGGVQGGISNGENIVFRVAFKPPATIAQDQETADFDGNTTTLATRGRHDPCVTPRAVAIVEAMAALCLADAALCQLARSASAGPSPY